MQYNSTNIELIEGLKQGNELVYAEIYNRYHQAVLLNIRKFVDHQCESEDILQEVFISLWNNRQKLTDSHSIGGWLFTTSYYKSLEHIKIAIKQSIVTFTEEMNDVFVLDEMDHAAESDYAYKLLVLNKAIEQLPARKRKAFELRRFEGKTYEEIAFALNISVASAKDYVKSASQLLKKSILSINVSTPALGLLFLAIFLQE